MSKIVSSYEWLWRVSFATVKTPDIQLAAEPDSTVNPLVYPAATVTVASTFDYADQKRGHLKSHNQ